MIFRREWAMPAADTFDCEPIYEFVRRYLSRSQLSVDPFSRNKRWATFTNDIDPATAADSHLDAEVFLKQLVSRKVVVDLLIFDPPYSPRQIAECYASVGLSVSAAETQNAALYKRVRDAAMGILSPSAVVLSFGWNSAGMGKARGFELEELLLVCHGGAHNDTICLAERRVTNPQQNLDLT